ncbi:MAG: DUF1460 domain-containing protein [Bdellovibrionales bacterium]|nr:DUF1460 domain-containing protein [Bdellovibrionales bacterium]
MLKLVALTLLFSLSAEAKDLSKLYSSLASMAPEARVLKSTRFFVNTPTGINPLGEGGGIDAHPQVSTDKFDCTTYVETNLAIAFSKDAKEMPSVLNKIRYKADNADFFQRNHFMVSDWIPANSKKNFVAEFTGQMTADKSAYHTETKTLNKTIWFFHRVIDLLDQQRKSPAEIQSELSKVPVLPVQEEKTKYLLASYFRDHADEMMAKLPEVSIVMFIRNIPSIPTLVNHMGFVLKKDGKLYLNHAPQAKPWKVQEVLLEDYFKDMDSHRAPIEGLLFLKVGKK